MGQTIYNEGRVVGLSAWEIFKRQALATGVPEKEIPNEHQWLASMVGAGSSMILRVPANDPDLSTRGVHDFELPETSSLSASGVIIASPFVGECSWDSSNWATSVASYGPLIQNDSSASPSSSSVPYYTWGGAVSFSQDVENSVAEFVKISDGIVYTKRANWIARTVDDVHVYIGDNSQTTWIFGTVEYPEQVTRVTSVTIDGTDVPETDYTLDLEHTPNSITFNTAPANEAVIRVEYVRVSSDPAKDIDPNFEVSTTVVRLYFETALEHDLYIMFTGFTNKHILQGLSGYAHTDEYGYSIGGSTDTRINPDTDTAVNDWENGGMLGPEIIPWASKIIFSVPSFAYNLANSLTRTIPLQADGELPAYEIPSTGLNFGDITIKQNSLASKVKPNSFIDFNSINLMDYYNAHGFDPDAPDPVLEEDVAEWDFRLGSYDSYNELVAWYPGMNATQIMTEIDRSPKSNANFFPPALYASQVTSSGTQSLVPLDVAAPGTVKGFTDATQAYNYKQLMPNNFALYNNVQNNTVSFVIKDESDETKWLGLSKLEYIANEAPKTQLTVGANVAQFVALTKPTSRPGSLQLYDLTGQAGQGAISIGPGSNLTWAHMLDALSQEKELDVLGSRLHALGNELSSASHTIGVGSGNTGITKVASQEFDLTGSYPVAITTSQNAVDASTNLMTLNSGTALKSGTEFIEFSNGLRLYISNTPNGPSTANVPEGSIGIGWVETPPV